MSSCPTPPHALPHLMPCPTSCPTPPHALPLPPHALPPTFCTALRKVPTNPPTNPSTNPPTDAPGVGAAPATLVNDFSAFDDSSGIPAVRTFTVSSESASSLLDDFAAFEVSASASAPAPAPAPAPVPAPAPAPAPAPNGVDGAAGDVDGTAAEDAEGASKDAWPGMAIEGASAAANIHVAAVSLATDDAIDVSAVSFAMSDDPLVPTSLMDDPPPVE